MKKIIFPVTILLSSLAASAQNASNTDNVTLNVKLKPIQTLVVNPNQKTIDLVYESEANYSAGVKSGVQANHLTVFSTGGFEVKVSSQSSELTTGTPGVNGNINSNTIKIAAAGNSSANFDVNATTFNTKPLSNTPEVIVSSTKGAVNKGIDIEYQGADANQYIDYYVNNQNPTVYSTTVTYTIMGK
jgi:hypothetical protein